MEGTFLQKAVLLILMIITTGVVSAVGGTICFIILAAEGITSIGGLQISFYAGAGVTAYFFWVYGIPLILNKGLEGHHE
jgi:hypothetical protein